MLHENITQLKWQVIENDMAPSLLTLRLQKKTLEGL
jgi:hypothetical protein